ncbi:ParB/RepB/Spo0J family partition protein [Patescibacteria group bacterium]|nr:ParB/RepB/Spo0J family partition protein [Patescibacteria group bacterium]
MSKKTLGRGLSSLIPSKVVSSTDISSDEKVLQLAVDRIQPNPYQPRQNFNREALEDLTNSIKVHGIIQPLVVLETEGGYQLIAGERRLRAAKLLGKSKVPAIVRKASDQEKLELALVENVQRENLNPIERAHGYQQLIDEYSLTQEEVAKKVGQSRAAVSNTIRLLTLAEEIQKAVVDSKITEGHAKVLLSVTSEKERHKLFSDILHNKLSVRITASRVPGFSSSQPNKYATKDPNLIEKEDIIKEALGTKVEINKKGPKGTIVIHYYSGEELQSIIRKISG